MNTNKSNQTTDTSRATAKRTLRGKVVVMAVAVAATGTMAAMTLGAPMANAKPISQSTIKSECALANGTYTAYNRGLSSCCYRDIISGEKSCDWDDNGEFVGTGPGVVRSPGAPLAPVETGSTPPVATRPTEPGV